MATDNTGMDIDIEGKHCKGQDIVIIKSLNSFLDG